MIGDTTASPTEARQEAATRTALMLVRSTHTKAILLVEGRTDAPFWRSVGRDKVHLILCGARDKVLKEMRALHSTRLFVELRAWGVQNPSYNFL